MNSHPGDLITRRYLEPLAMKAQDLASALNISKSQLSRILNGKCGMTADVAVRLEHVLNMKAEAWMNIQTAHDIEKAREGFDSSKLTSLTHLWYGEADADSGTKE